MTREKLTALRHILQRLEEEYKNYLAHGETNIQAIETEIEAVKEAISALSEPCEDCVSREAVEQETKWVFVKDGLPEYGKKVLIKLEHEKIVHDVAERVNYKHPQFSADYYWVGRYGYDPSNVIAWQPLPELPKGE